MTAREKRLRERIDVLTEQRDEARQRANGGGKAIRHCVFCGRRTKTSRVIPACASHRDLVAFDPNYSEVLA